MKSKLNLPNNINRLLLSETPLWAGWIGLCNLGSKVKSMCLSRLLNAPGLHLGPGCVVRGSKFIHFGRNVSTTTGGGGVVEIEDHVWIGDNAVIVGPIMIGRGSIVGANSVVRADVPEFTMVGGIPARALKHFEQATGQWEKL